MKERPITFTTEMIVAIREGRKTQTRRVIKDPNGLAPNQILSIHLMEAVYPAAESGWIFWHPDRQGLDEFIKQRYKNGIRCPYGQPGDRLWVKEWYTINAFDDVLYLTDWKSEGLEYEGMGWKSSRFMPKKYTRTWLEVTGVRVERLNDIIAEDAIAEGILVGPSEGKRYAFSQLWDSINARRGYGWDANPWVWVVSFELREEQEA
jgi:hypothetical protein